MRFFLTLISPHTVYSNLHSWLTNAAMCAWPWGWWIGLKNRFFGQFPQLHVSVFNHFSYVSRSSLSHSDVQVSRHLVDVNISVYSASVGGLHKDSVPAKVEEKAQKKRFTASFFQKGIELLRWKWRTGEAERLELLSADFCIRLPVKRVLLWACFEYDAKCWWIKNKQKKTLKSQIDARLQHRNMWNEVKWRSVSITSSFKI